MRWFCFADKRAVELCEVGLEFGGFGVGNDEGLSRVDWATDKVDIDGFGNDQNLELAFYLDMNGLGSMSNGFHN